MKYGILIGFLLAGCVGVAEAQLSTRQAPATAQSQLFIVKKVTSQDEAKRCYAERGLAAQLATLDEDGDVTSPWIGACLIPVTKN